MNLYRNRPLPADEGEMKNKLKQPKIVIHETSFLNKREVREAYDLLLKIAKSKEVDSWKSFLRPVKKGKHHLLVSEYDDRIVGMFSVNFLPKSKVVFIDYIVVDKNFRHKHLATKMFRKG